MMGVRRWFLHNLRRALGTVQAQESATAQAARLAEQNADLLGRVAALAARAERSEAALTGRIERMEAAVAARIDQLEAATRQQVIPTGCTLLDLNGDPLVLPNELVKYLIHTRVNDPAEPVPKLLAETQHYLWCRQRLSPGDTAWDVGSNIGLFAVMMARRVKYGNAGTIHAIEASPTIFNDLKKVLMVNGAANVCATHAAAADRPGTLTFVELAADNAVREGSHLLTEGRDDPNAPGRVQVPAVTLDGYAAYHGGMKPRLIKIDVEGAEFLVLDGVRKTIGDCHPYLCIEIHPDPAGVFDHARLRAYLDEYGYRYTHDDKTYYCE